MREDDVTALFARNAIDLGGDIVASLEAVARWRGPKRSPSLLRAMPRSWLDRAARGVRRVRLSDLWSETKATTTKHPYDASREFYRLLLGPNMLHSSATFVRGDETLDDAQRLKLDRIARKLELRYGDDLLDLGCGWGSFLEHAATQIGAQCLGTTLSRAQFSEVSLRTESMRSAVRVLQRDFRELPDEAFDKIASIGTMDRLERSDLATYFDELGRRLRPGGLLLNQASVSTGTGDALFGWFHLGPKLGRASHRTCADTAATRLSEVITAAERSGLEVRSVESLRRDHARTLGHWLRNLESHFVEAGDLVGVELARRWRLYLAVSVLHLRAGDLDVLEVLFAKPGPALERSRPSVRAPNIERAKTGERLAIS
ncbi:MAG TPA: class I SAM-dependent methyltransferase [Polyangiaceae bacterium]